MNLTKSLSPNPSNLLTAGLVAGVTVITTMLARRNNPAPTPGMDTAIRAAKWGVVGYVAGSFINVPKIFGIKTTGTSRLSDRISTKGQSPLVRVSVTTSPTTRRSKSKSSQRAAGKRRTTKRKACK